MSPTATEPEIRMDGAALERYDGAIENAITGIGDANYDKSKRNTPGRPTQLSFDEKGDLYESSWIIRKICDAYPFEATREWLEIKMGANADAEAIAKFAKYDQKLKTADAFRYAQTWANIYKGAGIFVVVDDGRPHNQPINKKGIRSIKRLEPLDCNDLRPDTSKRFDPLNPDQYMLTRSRQDQDSNDFPPYVHPDRIIRFDGFHLPPKQMQKNQNWGGSIIDSIWDAISRYESSQASVASMVQDYNVFIYAMKGLAGLIASSDESNMVKLRNRLKSIRLTMSNLKGLVLDSENESANFITRNFAGLSEVLGIFRDELIGASNLPHTVVFGSSPSGMGATGESEEHTWAIQVGQYQKAMFLPKLMPLYELIWLAKDGPTGGKEPEDWSVQFKSLLVQSDKDDADLRSTQSNTDRTYVDMGVLLPEEVRRSRFGGSNYTIETTLDEEAWEEKKQQDQFGFGGFGGDMGGGDPAAADPNADPNAAPAEGEAPAEEAATPPEEAPVPEEPAPITTDRADSLTLDARRSLRKIKGKGKGKPCGKGWTSANNQCRAEMVGKAALVAGAVGAVAIGAGVAIAANSGKKNNTSPSSTPSSTPTPQEPAPSRSVETKQSEVPKPSPSSPNAQSPEAKKTEPVVKKPSEPKKTEATKPTPPAASSQPSKLETKAPTQPKSPTPVKAEAKPQEPKQKAVATPSPEPKAAESTESEPTKRIGEPMGDFQQIAYHPDVNTHLHEWLSFYRRLNDPAADKPHTNLGQGVSMTSNIQSITGQKGNPEVKAKHIRSIVDKNGVLQSAAWIDEHEDHIRIENLATAPWNITGNDKRATKGAGSAMLEAIAREAVSKNKGIRLESTSSANEFYEKAGMEDDGSGIYFSFTPEQAKAFLAKQEAKRKTRKDSNPSVGGDRADGNDPIKRVEKRGGLHIGVTHDPGDTRFNRSLLEAGYGHIRRSYGQAEDKKSIDVYLGPEQNGDRIFKIHQVDPNTGFKDETKYCIGFSDPAQARDAVLLNLPRDRFGFIEEVDPSELATYRADCSADCGCACGAAKDEEKPKRKRRKPKPSGRSLELIEDEVQRESPKSDSRSNAKGDAAEDEKDLGDYLLENATKAINPVVKDWLKQIKGFIADQRGSGASLEQVRDRLPTLFNQLEGDRFAETLYQKSVLANLGGRDEVLSE